VSTNTITIRDITLEQLQVQAGDLLQQHYEELSVDTDAWPLSPDWTNLEALAAGGLVHVAGAFVDDKMVGYVGSLLVRRHLHYPFGYVQNDVLFVAKSHRSSSVGGRLMRSVRDWAKEMGAAQIFWHAKEDTELHRQLDRPNGRYTLRDLIYSEKV
tara:strand:- start:8815 stop:9282 length:468 start_codon:yes stop_codon:yes gene_type:complete